MVADDVGATAEIVGDGGLLTGGVEGWLKALHALGGDANLRARVGARGRARAQAYFSVRRWAPELAALLRASSLGLQLVPGPEQVRAPGHRGDREHGGHREREPYGRVGAAQEAI
ncbi:MAG TPA: hypothetical protein VHR88_12890, partial [Solirubrobacteraceae bacterium]|nr:hypothetical protein [Solirubrobacteraceae bacterium]